MLRHRHSDTVFLHPSRSPAAVPYMSATHLLHAYYAARPAIRHIFQRYSTPPPMIRHTLKMPLRQGQSAATALPLLFAAALIRLSARERIARRHYTPLGLLPCISLLLLTIHSHGYHYAITPYPHIIITCHTPLMIVHTCDSSATINIITPPCHSVYGHFPLRLRPHTLRCCFAISYCQS
jgi:hypothetical protein